MASTSRPADGAGASGSGFFSNLFGQRPNNDGPDASVLAEWNKYSGDSAGECTQKPFSKVSVPQPALTAVDPQGPPPLTKP